MGIRFAAVVCVLIGFVPTLDAADIVAASVDRVEGRYHVDFVVMIEGETGPLHGIVTDYARMDEFSPTVVESRLLSGCGGEDARIEVVLRSCVLMVFCRTLTKVSDVHVGPDMMRVRYVTVPGLGDFQEGHETITMMQESIDGRPHVRFRYTAQLKPQFTVPPLLGTWLIRRTIINDLETTSRRLERMLQRDGR